MNKSGEKILVTLRLRVRAGGAISGPPLGPALGQYGIPIGPFCDSFNDQTSLFRSSFPLMVYLSLKGDGSYDYYIYMPATTFFFKTILKMSRWAVTPPDAPEHHYFLQYLSMHISGKTGSELSSLVNRLFMEVDLAEIRPRRRYLTDFKKGAFRSITPELLFESVDCYAIRELELNFCRSFLELVDYFLVDYNLLFFFVNYLEALSNVLLDYRLFEDDSISIDIGGDVQEDREILSDDGVDNMECMKSTSEEEPTPEMSDEVSEADEPSFTPLWYSDFVKVEEFSVVTSSVPLVLIRAVADALLHYKNLDAGKVAPASSFNLSVLDVMRRLSVSEIVRLSQELIFLELAELLYKVHGLTINIVFAEWMVKNLQNPLFDIATHEWEGDIPKYIASVEWVDSVQYDYIFSYSMYVSCLLVAQREYHTQYDFRNVHTYSASFRRFCSQLKGQSVFVKRGEACSRIARESSLLRMRDMVRRKVFSACIDFI